MVVFFFFDIGDLDESFLGGLWFRCNVMNEMFSRGCHDVDCCVCGERGKKCPPPRWEAKKGNLDLLTRKKSRAQPSTCSLPLHDLSLNKHDASNEVDK